MIEAIIGIAKLLWTAIKAFFNAHWIFAIILIGALISFIIALLKSKR